MKKIVKIKIIAGQPFESRLKGDPVISISFSPLDMRSGNRARVLPRWDEKLLKLEKAGLIRVLERPETNDAKTDEPDAAPEPPVEPADIAKPAPPKPRRRRKKKAVD